MGCSIGWARRRRRGSHGPGLELRGAGLLRFRLRVVARAGEAGDGLGLPARTTEGITTSPTARRPARSDGGPGRRSVPRRGHSASTSSRGARLRRGMLLSRSGPVHPPPHTHTHTPFRPALRAGEARPRGDRR